jgi:hypothetical protein
MQAPRRGRSSEPLLVLTDDAVIELEPCPGTCRPNWCSSCRREIRQEAARWLRELNVTPEMRRLSVTGDQRVRVERIWHPAWMLSD